VRRGGERLRDGRDALLAHESGRYQTRPRARLVVSAP
jgi:hypothetical protein